MRDLFFLTCGSVRAPAFAYAQGLGASLVRGVTLSVTVAVAVRDNGEIVLVDAGWSEARCASGGGMRLVGPLTTAMLGIRVRPGDGIAAQLRRSGLDPSRVRTVVATHLHFDHVGGVADFPNGEVVCTDRELAAYRSPGHWGYRAEDLARAGRVRTVALAGGPAYGFPSSYDLFGDGEIVVLDARGHTAGNIAVALRGPAGCFVHVGDAAFHAWEWALTPRGPSLFGRVIASNRADLARTYASIRACEADPRHPVIVPSHDHDVLERLPRAPRVESKGLSASTA